MNCLIGRTSDCALCFEGDEDGGISRHHCLLDINPPDVTIRDLGSTNGTYLNGENIGLSESEKEQKLDDHYLKDGDFLKIGDVLIDVEIQKKLEVCDDCNTQISDSELEFCVIENTKLCKKCQDKIKTSIYNQCFNVDNFTTVKMEIDEFEKQVSINEYKIEKVLGEGGMGKVYLATNKTHFERVAIKIMLPQVSMNKKAQKNFLRELNITKNLEHKNIVALKGTGYSNGSYFFTMEYCNESSLDLLIRREGRLDYKLAVDLTLQILDGLSHAHNILISDSAIIGVASVIQGLVHRDIKPGNIFLQKDDKEKLTAKIGDFGLAKVFDSEEVSGFTKTETIAGTLYFIPKHQVLNFKDVGPEVDLWATVATLYYMLTGKYPRRFKEGADSLKQLLETEPIPILNHGIDIPAELAKVIDKALDDSSELYYKDAKELKKDIENSIL